MFSCKPREQICSGSIQLSWENLTPEWSRPSTTESFLLLLRTVNQSSGQPGFEACTVRRASCEWLQDVIPAQPRNGTRPPHSIHSHGLLLAPESQKNTLAVISKWLPVSGSEKGHLFHLEAKLSWTQKGKKRQPSRSSVYNFRAVSYPAEVEAAASV